MISHGLRLRWLGTPEFTWRDLLVIVREAPMGGALSRAMSPKTWEWDLPTQLLAVLLNATVGKQVVKIPGSNPDEKTAGKGALPSDELHKFLYGGGS